MKVDTHGIIPTHRLAQIIRPHVEQLGMRTTAEMTGIAERRLYGILHNEHRTCSLSTADRLLTRLDLVDFWHLSADEGGLADVYPDWPADELDSRWAQARKLRAEGWSYPRIAREFNVTHTTIMYWCDDYYRQHKLRHERKRYRADEAYRKTKLFKATGNKYPAAYTRTKAA